MNATESRPFALKLARGCVCERINGARVHGSWCDAGMRVRRLVPWLSLVVATALGVLAVCCAYGSPEAAHR